MSPTPARAPGAPGGRGAPVSVVPDQDQRQPAADARVRAAAAVLAGEPVREVAARHDVDVPQLLRWVQGLSAGGASAVGGVGIDRPARGPHATTVPVEDYLQVVAHELRTPLTAARTGLRVLSRDDLSPAVRADVAATVLDRLRAMDQLSQDVLDTVAVASGRLPLQPERVDLTAAVAASASTHGIRCRPQRPLHVLADPARLDQVLASLVRHGLRYVPPEAVAVETAALPDAALVTVRLTGFGLHPDQAQSVLEPFGAASRGDGNGLSLYVVRTLVVASGGSVGVAGQGEPDTPGASTVFWLRLPLAAGSPSAPFGADDPLREDRTR